MRALIRTALVDAPGRAALGLTADAIVAGRGDMGPSGARPMPFVVLKWGSDRPGVSGNLRVSTRTLDLWVHDQGEDYTRIDRILSWARTAFTEVAASRDAITGGWALDVMWQGAGADLRDPERGTILRIGTFTVVGS